MAHRARLLGGPVDVADHDEVIAFIAGAVGAGRKAIVGNQNLHSLCLSRTDAAMRDFFAAADLIEIDSMPLLQWGRLMGLRLSEAHRCTYLDWRERFWDLAARRRWRVFCLGAAAPTNAAALERLGRAFPGAVLGGRHGYFDHARGAHESRAVVAAINAFRPDVLLVGMGMPLQEKWIAEHYGDLVSGVVLSVGGAFDYEAGVQKPAPRIYGRLCLEWLYRLAHEPRRLGRRYLIEPWSLIGPAAEDLARAFRRRPARRPAFGYRLAVGAEEAAAEDDLPRAA
ncbi:MAG TPA: WecB/TagA/CpsF family glycosyltransferase [Caulobacteraceae bacterium]|nr:WecB/TagA/CpsF family glycosyltransferase [Caulobacteraceae bacterium]